MIEESCLECRLEVVTLPASKVVNNLPPQHSLGVATWYYSEFAYGN